MNAKKCEEEREKKDKEADEEYETDQKVLSALRLGSKLSLKASMAFITRPLGAAITKFLGGSPAAGAWTSGAMGTFINPPTPYGMTFGMIWI